MSPKRSLPGKGQTEYNIIQDMQARGPYLGDPIAKCIRHVRTTSKLRRQRIDFCLLDSATYAASLAGRNLAAAFSPARAEDGQLRWIERSSPNEKWGSLKVAVDWDAGIIRDERGLFGLLEDVEDRLYALKPVDSPQRMRRPAGPAVAPRDAWEDITEATPSLASVPETERKAVIDARLGQGRFRAGLMDLWGRCAVTGCRNGALLRASHINPWRNCENQERLDKYNGFLLTPALDHLFDSGLISFGDGGDLLSSPRLPTQDAQLLGVHGGMRLCFVYEENKPYLRAHRQLHGFEKK